MNLESLKLINFRCFGPDGTTVRFEPNTTVFIGANGAGKTAVMQALQRMFGIASDSRRVRRQDFHVPATEVEEPDERTFSLEAIFSFPELGDGRDITKAVPAFWHQMAADDDGALKCRLRLNATWTNNGLDGSIDDQMVAIKSLDDVDTEDQEARVLGATRSQIQFVYVPAVRDATSQLASLLKGRLWQAINWSNEIVTELGDSGSKLNAAFLNERGVDSFLGTLTQRWQEVHGGGTHSQPLLRPVNSKLDDFVRNVGVVFRPDETGRDRAVEELSDGQRSMFCISLVSATLDVESKIRDSTEGFNSEAFSLPVLTLIGVEEPENNLMPFYLSRIIEQIRDITSSDKIQALISSHSASVLSRIEPFQIRHFRSSPAGSSVRNIPLPGGEEEYKFVREAVRAYPELYFSSFVVLGEGSSEEIVIPRVAESLGLPIDRSFVAIVPLGGRHVNHLWRLLSDLKIPYATLLDLDLGRNGGGKGRIKYAVDQLKNVGVDESSLFIGEDLTAASLEVEMSTAILNKWCDHLRSHGVFYSYPLDIDMTMFTALPGAYKAAAPDGGSPSTQGDAVKAVLGEKGDQSKLGDLPYDWYRYLFLGRGKPTIHAKALSSLSDDELLASAPEGLCSLIRHVAKNLPSTSVATDTLL